MKLIIIVVLCAFGCLELADAQSNGKSVSNVDDGPKKTEGPPKSDNDDMCVCVCNQVCGGGQRHRDTASSENDQKGNNGHGHENGHQPPGQMKKSSNGGGSRHKRHGHGHDAAHGGGHNEEQSSQQGTQRTESSSSSTRTSTTTTSTDLEYKESTYKNSNVWIVSNDKKMKRCPQEQCSCPCVCNRGGHMRGNGSDRGQMDGNVPKNGGGSGQKNHMAPGQAKKSGH